MDNIPITDKPFGAAIWFVETELTEYTRGIRRLRTQLHHYTEQPATEKFNGYWRILFPVSSLILFDRLTWIQPDRGKFYIDGKSVHFRIDGLFIYCW